jgi:hypothetical protein
MMYYFGIDYYELYPINDKKHSMTFSLEVKVDYICSTCTFMSWLIFCVCRIGMYHVNEKA